MFSSLAFMRPVMVLTLGLLISGCASYSQELDDLLGTGTGEDIAPIDLGTAENAEDLKRQMIVNIGDRIFFDIGSNKLNQPSRRTLSRQASFLSQNGQLTATIEGHCDERGTRAYNIGLGLRRANIVRDYLVSQGVAASRLKIVSYGKERPVAPCSRERCWRLNRRVVLAIDAGA